MIVKNKEMKERGENKKEVGDKIAFENSNFQEDLFKMVYTAEILISTLESLTPLLTRSSLPLQQS